jgi:hypothetical protein
MRKIQYEEIKRLVGELRKISIKISKIFLRKIHGYNLHPNNFDILDIKHSFLLILILTTSHEYPERICYGFVHSPEYVA